MQERSIHSRNTDYDGTTGAAARPEQHYDLVVRPTGGPAPPPCDCGAAGPPPPPPRFLLPPPPVDPAWAAAEEDICDIVAPLQVCRARSGMSAAGADLHPSPSMSMLAALITTSLFLFIVLVAGTIFFCKHRRRLGSLMSSKDSDKRGETSRMLYDDLSRRPHVMPTSLRPGGPHIEMVAVKGGHCPPQLLPGLPVGPGTLFVYPPAPSLTDDGSERLSNMYEEIPYYGRPVPSVSCCSDSDDDVISHLSEGGDGVGTGGRTEPRYVCSLPAGPPGGRQRHHRSSPSGPHRHPALRRKDPYYYSDILARDAGDVGGAGPYRTPYDERRPSTATDATGPRSAAGRDTPPLACRMAADPFSDLYGGQTADRRRPPLKFSSFRGAADPAGGDSEVYVNSSGRMVVPRDAGLPVRCDGEGDTLRRLRH